MCEGLLIDSDVIHTSAPDKLAAIVAADELPQAATSRGGVERHIHHLEPRQRFAQERHGALGARASGPGDAGLQQLRKRRCPIRALGADAAGARRGLGEELCVIGWALFGRCDGAPGARLQAVDAQSLDREREERPAERVRPVDGRVNGNARWGFRVVA
jgi:hypothetical protein